MFCPDCGKPDQIADTYCRACGQFLGSQHPLAFGGSTPQQNLTSIRILSSIGALASLVVAFWMYLTRFDLPIVLYLAAALLVCNAMWHISNLVVGSKLARRMKRADGELSERSSALTNRETSELILLEDKGEPVPQSVIEDTTRNLAEKRNR